MSEPPPRPLSISEIHKYALAEVKVGDRLCEVGRGTSNVIHKHWTVSRMTKLYFVREWVAYGTAQSARFRRDNGRSVPYSDYGGSHVYTTCQRPKADS